MAEQNVAPTKILFIENDEASFQIRQCVARALAGLPPLELYHAHDATEALAMLERLNPDVVVLDDAEPEEQTLFLDSLSANHPPVVVQTDGEIAGRSFSLDQQVTKVPRSESLEGIHQTLVLAASLGARFISAKLSRSFH